MLKYLSFILITLALLISSGYAAEKKGVKAYPLSSHYIDFSDPVPFELTGNPLDYAGRRIDMDVRNFELPKGWEGRYRYAARYPIIDYVSNNPLYMKQWTEDTSALIIKAHTEKGIGAVHDALSVLRGTDAYPESEVIHDPELMLEFKDFLAKTDFTNDYKNILTDFYESYVSAWLLVQKGCSNLSQEDIDFFMANPLYYLAPDGIKMVEITGNIDSAFTFIEHARKVRYECIFHAAKIMSDGINEYVKATNGFTPEKYFTDTAKSDSVYEIELSTCKLVIGGSKDNNYPDDTDILIDLGGNDTYENNAGGAMQTVAVLIDHSGNDTYTSKDRRYVMGFGLLGAGFLVDLSGRDSYDSQSASQGAGIMGVGVLCDKGGDDTYSAGTLVQGAGMFGLGMLLDDSGEDLYNCASLGQAGATALGLGILSDLQGDDRYQLAIEGTKDTLNNMVGYGQGGALSFRQYPWIRKLTPYGGVGLLVDNAGNDRYRTGGWCDQGGSYIMSLGALYDADGNDHYTANTGQGGGIHITNAILIDKNGHDTYDGGFRCGGSGGDRTPSFLIDYHGNDVYKSSSSNFGTGCKPFSYSLFIDYEGDDTYIAPNPVGKITMNNWESVGGVWPESVSYLWPYGICLDLGGKDDYQVKQRKNNSEHTSFGHGIHLDCEWYKGDIIGNVPNPLPPYELFDLPESVRRSPYNNDIKMLQSPDTFIRFQAIGHIINSNPEIVKSLVDSILDSTHRQFNRDVMECINYFLVDKKMSADQLVYLQKLLKAQDREMRILVADDLGLWNVMSAEDALIEATNDKDDQVRRFAMGSLNLMQSKKGLQQAYKLAIDDPSEDVRRTSIVYLTNVKGEKDPYPVLANALDKDQAPSVKVAAAEGIGYLQNREGFELLRKYSKSNDYYVQRACARSMCDLYDLDGIEILMKSLDFPSIDAFFNYNRNVPNNISAYTGHDFTEAERYDQNLWMTWLKENRDKIDIKKNADDFVSFRHLETDTQNLDQDDQIAPYEEFLKQHPDNVKAKLGLVEKLNGSAWTMITAAKDSDKYNPEKGLEYALRCVELDNQLGNVDTLIEAYIVLNRLDDAMAIINKYLETNPGNGQLLEDKTRIEKMKTEK
jgi:hypothetical protein